MATTLSTIAAAAVLRAVAAPAIKAIANGLKIESDKVRAQFTSTFTPHLENTFMKCAYVKTIFSGERYLPLEDIYINLYLTCDGKICKDEEVIGLSGEYKRVVVVGTGGAGKTMLMRHLALQCHAEPKGTIPIFIELRNLPGYEDREFYRLYLNSLLPRGITARTLSS
jgi:predicted NACHT family NTPase